MKDKVLKIKKCALKGRIDDFLFEKMHEGEYVVFAINPKKLLTFNRLDLCFKILYLELLSKIPSFAEKIYYEDIKCLTLGSFSEPGNASKNSFRNFLKDFDAIFNSISKREFCSDKSLVPLATDKSILNGSHRTASSIVAYKHVWCIETQLNPMVCNFRTYLGRGVDLNILEFAILKYVELSNNIYVVFLWPSIKNKWDEFGSLFHNIVYEKKIKLTFQGKFNLLYLLYAHMEWIGSKEKKYPGIKVKLEECFSEGDEVKVVFLESNSLAGVQQIKKSIRERCNIGFSAIHATDNYDEAVSISRLILNKNGFHFLNNANILKSNIDKISLDICKLVQNADFIISGSSVLSAYGIRRNDDVDVIFSDEEVEKNLFGHCSSHLKYLDVERLDLLFNPDNYFIYRGVKFLSLKNLELLKKKRNEKKDIIDLELIDKLNDSCLFNMWILNFRQRIFFLKTRLKRCIYSYSVSFLKKIKLYNFFKYIYHILKFHS